MENNIKERASTSAFFLPREQQHGVSLKFAVRIEEFDNFVTIDLGLCLAWPGHGPSLFPTLTFLQLPTPRHLVNWLEMLAETNT